MPPKVVKNPKIGEECDEPFKEGQLVGCNPVGEYYGGRNNKNERHGRGRAVLPNGDLYLGCYFKGRKHGMGIYSYKKGNGARYGGDWHFDVKKGWGTMYFPDGAQYTGNWDYGLMHGWGVYVFPNGDEYEGWWYGGRRNGRGIYRTKATGEKFVGNWLLGKKHGSGMLIRKNHRFIGNYHNDVPRGPGVYIFPDLGCEQHGSYVTYKISDTSITHYQDHHYQVLQMREETPINPIGLEKSIRDEILNGGTKPLAEVRGEDEIEGEEMNAGEPAEAPKPPEEIVEIKSRLSYDRAEKDRLIELQVGQKVKEAMDAVNESLIPVVPIWRVIQITPLMTPFLDESVPPPPMPEPPLPPFEPAESEEGSEPCMSGRSDGEDSDTAAKRLAMTHKLGEAYTGASCQPDDAVIKWPDDLPCVNFSKMSISTLEEFKSAVQAVVPQIEPLDMDALIAANLHLFKGQGTDVTERWKETLGGDTDCANPEMRDKPECAGMSAASGSQGSGKPKEAAKSKARASKKASHVAHHEEPEMTEDEGEVAADETALNTQAPSRISKVEEPQSEFEEE